MKYSKNTFTLLELLVVIAIIGILTTLLLPSLSNARIASMKAVCKSNLSQIYSLQMIYSKNNNHHLTFGEIQGDSDFYDNNPQLRTFAGYSWDDFLSDYDGRDLTVTEKKSGALNKQDYSFDLYECPLAKNKSTTNAVRNYAMNRGWYRGNGHLNGIAWNYGSMNIAQIEDPETMMYYEMDNSVLRIGRAQMGNSSDAYYRGSWGPSTNWADHHGKLYIVNVLKINGSMNEETLNSPALWSRDLD